MKNSLNIQSLFEQIANDDPVAFRLFFNYTYSDLYRYTCYFIDDTELCKDVISDVYFYLWKNRRKLPDIQDIENYLFVCVRNQALHYIRENNRFQKIKLEDAYPDNISDKINPEQQVLNEELKNIIELAVNALPQKCRQIFFMVRIEEMKYKEVAKNLSISERTVHAQMCIAIKKIGRVINEYQAEYKKESVK